MKYNKKIIMTICLIIALVFSFLIFFGFGNIEKSSIQICSFIFILITEIIAYGILLLLTFKKFNTFMIAGISSATFIYSIVSFLFNIVILGVFKTLRSILVFNFSFLLIYFFIVVLLFLFKKED